MTYPYITYHYDTYPYIAYTYIHIHMHTLTHTHFYTCTYTYAHAYASAHTVHKQNIYIYIRIHIYIYIHIYIHCTYTFLRDNVISSAKPRAHCWASMAVSRSCSLSSKAKRTAPSFLRPAQRGSDLGDVIILWWPYDNHLININWC
jgi:hypothetical protein